MVGKRMAGRVRAEWSRTVELAQAHGSPGGAAGIAGSVRRASRGRARRLVEDARSAMTATPCRPG